MTAAGRLIGVRRPSRFSHGGTFSLDFRTEPNGRIAVFVDGERGATMLPELEQTVLLVAPASPAAVGRRKLTISAAVVPRARPSSTPTGAPAQAA